MPDADGTPTEAEWLEGRYPGAREKHEAKLEDEREEERLREEALHPRVVVEWRCRCCGRLMEDMRGHAPDCRFAPSS